jgi:hypothetical protein
LNPSLSVFRNFDDSLYTVEAGVSHELDLDVASVEVDASIGNTDLTDSTDRTYYSVGVAASKSLSDSAGIQIGLDYVDADDVDREFVLGTALTFNF